MKTYFIYHYLFDTVKIIIIIKIIFPIDNSLYRKKKKSSTNHHHTVDQIVGTTSWILCLNVHVLWVNATTISFFKQLLEVQSTVFYMHFETCLEGIFIFIFIFS